MRFPTSLLAAATIAGGLVIPLGASTASHAATTTKPVWTYKFTQPGTYQLTVPALADGTVHLQLAGASGTDGGSTFRSRGGKGGNGADIRAALSAGTMSGATFTPGEKLTIVVGKQGAGTHQGDGAGGGDGDEADGGARGGDGGGASWVTDTDAGRLIALAGGGGGGGGAGDSGTGGTDGGSGGGAASDSSGNGSRGSGFYNGEGAAGAGGDSLVCGPAGVTHGGILGLTGGGSGIFGTGSGGGGGGGGGDCGGHGGGGGNYGTAGLGMGGGGGGGAGGSFYRSAWAPDTGAGQLFAFDHIGAGTVALGFEVDANPAGEATFTSANALTIGSEAVTGSFQVTAVADPTGPTPTYSLLGAPSWVSIDPDTGLLSATGFRAVGAAGSYPFIIVARVGDSRAAITQRFTITVDTAPTYPRTADALGSIRTGQTKTWTYAVPSYPPATYSISSPDPWISINPTTGVVTAKPPAGSEGNHYFYVFARNGVDPTVNRYSTLTVVTGPRPVVTSLSRRTLGQGASTGVTLRGRGFQPGASVGFGSTSLRATSVKVVDSTTITFRLRAAVTTAPGTYAVRVTDPDGLSSRRASSIRVTARPTIRMVSQLAPVHKHAATLDIRGAAFQTGARVTVSGTGITVKSVKRVSAGRLTVRITVTSRATAGSKAVTVANPDGGRSTKRNAFRLRLK